MTEHTADELAQAEAEEHDALDALGSATDRYRDALDRVERARAAAADRGTADPLRSPR